VQNMDTRNFVARVPGFTLLSIEESRHEILMESNTIRQRFFAAFDAFMGVKN
jgi:alpha-beta hydrolase superfamily lysophospholipase